jgi:hypothetical protein
LGVDEIKETDRKVGTREEDSAEQSKCLLCSGVTACVASEFLLSECYLDPYSVVDLVSSHIYL